MTCVLSMTPIYSGFTDDVCDINSKNADDFEVHWISKNSSAPEVPRCATPCRFEAVTSNGCKFDVTNVSSLGTLRPNGADSRSITNNVCDKVQTAARHAKGNGLRNTDIKIESNLDGLFDMCKETQTGAGIHEPVARGLKRKLDADSILEDVYVPPKRISPFLNTPKEKKDERKKILKLSIKKLKQLEDPEAFLRRTVLVNNTRKRIQNELKSEKVSGRKFEFGNRKSYMASYDVLSNSCLSNSYLFDDPFLSGVHEKITDDMTDTLINNLKDKLCDASEEAMDTSSPSSCSPSGPSAQGFSEPLYNNNAFSVSERKSKASWSSDSSHEHKIDFKVCEFQALNKAQETRESSKPVPNISSRVGEHSSCLDGNMIPRRCLATTQSVLSVGDSTAIDTSGVAEMSIVTNDNEPDVSLATASANACEQVPAEFSQWKHKHSTDVHVYSPKVQHNIDNTICNFHTESNPENLLSEKFTYAATSDCYNNNRKTNSDRTQSKCCRVHLDLNSNFPRSNSLLSDNATMTTVMGANLGSASLYDPANITLCKQSSQHSCSLFPVNSDNNQLSMHTCQC